MRGKYVAAVFRDRRKDAMGPSRVRHALSSFAEFCRKRTQRAFPCLAAALACSVVGGAARIANAVRPDCTSLDVLLAIGVFYLLCGVFAIGAPSAVDLSDSIRSTGDVEESGNPTGVACRPAFASQRLAAVPLLERMRRHRKLVPRHDDSMGHGLA
jgi:hypothetical protein